MNVGEMVKEALENLGGKASTAQIKGYIKNKFGDINEGTIGNFIIACSVNNPSRVNYQYNNKPRVANTKIDFLAKIEKGEFAVFELKLSKGLDQALGQLLRYMGWVKINLVGNTNIHGIIMPKKIDNKLKYAAAINPGIKLFEYELEFKIR